MKRAFLACLLGLGSACASVPITGRSQLLLMSPETEKKMGDEAYRELMKKAKLSENASQTAMLRRVGARLSAVAERPDFQWEFNLIEDDKSVNAFCLPGGKVAFYTGILPVTQTEAGAAVVMGHEIGHAIARHGAERMSQGMVTQLGGQALSIFLGNRNPAAQGVFDRAYGTGAAVGIILPFSRKHESEADEIGLILMAKAGYDPREAVAFWKRMDAASKDASSPMAKLLSTHPSHENRIAALQKHLPEALKYYKR